MTTKTDVKRLLSKGLTGKEAGKLLLQDNWLVDHAEEGFLSGRDISSIKASLKTTQDIQDYNSYVETYRIIDYTLKDAHIMALMLQVRMGAIIKIIGWYAFGYSSEMDIKSTPVIMTEKEYEDHKADQRKKFLKELSSLDEAMLFRAYTITPEEIKEKAPEDKYFLAWLKREHPGIWKQVVSDILDLLRAGKLRPALITGKDKDDLTLLWDKIKEILENSPFKRIPREELIDKAIAGNFPSEEDHIQMRETHKLYQQEEALLRSLYEARKGKSQDKLISSLEKIQEGSLSQEEEDEILLYAFCPGEELYQSSLPEQVKWIDEFKPGYFSTERDEDIGLRGVAIIKDPSPNQLDERGHYKRSPTGRDVVGSMVSGDVPDIGQGVRIAKDEIKLVLAFQNVMKAVSEVIGIDFAEDINSWVEDVQDIVAEYNRLAYQISILDRIPDNVKDAIQPINIEKLKPSAQTIKYLRERIAMSLGEGWWEDVKGILLDDLREKEAQDG